MIKTNHIKLHRSCGLFGTEHIFRCNQKTVILLAVFPRHRERIVPLFPELRTVLNQHFFSLDETEENEFVIEQYRRSSWNLGTPFQLIAQRTYWGKTHNLRTPTKFSTPLFAETASVRIIVIKRNSRFFDTHGNRQGQFCKNSQKKDLKQ
jgi:hypothetical protein